jgi:hypothetical protein
MTAAVTRAAEPTDWRSVGQAHVAKIGIDEAALDAVDAALRTQIDA